MDALVSRSANDQEKRIRIMEAQREIVMLQSDIGRKEARRSIMDAELKKLHADMQRITVEKNLKDAEKKKLENELRILQEDLRLVKKKMNLLV